MLDRLGYVYIITISNPHGQIGL